jgi:hypothetical protein
VPVTPVAIVDQVELFVERDTTYEVAVAEAVQLTVTVVVAQPPLVVTPVGAAGAVIAGHTSS